LRYNFIQEETKKFQAIKISHEIDQLNVKLQESAANVEKVQARVDKLKEQRELRRLNVMKLKVNGVNLVGKLLKKAVAKFSKYKSTLVN
jgi:hypothetical protein